MFRLGSNSRRDTSSAMQAQTSAHHAQASDRKMRVAMVWLGAISGDTGGRTYLREILGPLTRTRNLNLELYLTDRAFDVPPGCRAHYFPDLRVGSIGRIAMEPLVMRQIQRERYDVLLAPFNYLPAGWRGPSVVVQHNLLAGKGAPRRRRPIRSAYRRLALASSVRRATRVIAVSAHLRDRLLEWYPHVEPSRVHVVPLAPATELLAAPVRQRENRPRTVLVVGALWSHKGVGEAIDAFSIVAAKNADLRLLIGRPGTPSAQRAVFRPRQTIRGSGARGGAWQSHTSRARPAVPGVLCSSLSSRIESFGLPVVEAMAMGVPVVARRIPALVEVADDAPFWVEVDAAPTSVARALDQALSDDRARAHAISRGLSLAATLSWSRTAELTADVLAEAIVQPVAAQNERGGEAPT